MWVGVNVTCCVCVAKYRGGVRPQTGREVSGQPPPLTSGPREQM